MGVSHYKNCSYRDLLHFLHHRHTTIARLVEGFSRQTANNRSPLTFESRESHFVSRSIHAFHVLGGRLVQPYMLDIVLTYLYHVQVS